MGSSVYIVWREVEFTGYFRFLEELREGCRVVCRLNFDFLKGRRDFLKCILEVWGFFGEFFISSI